jgi:hypothetical protein
MALMVKVASEAKVKEAQERMEQDYAEAGILQLPSNTPRFYLMARDDLPALTEIAATYRCKPIVSDAMYEDVPDGDEIDLATEDLVEFVHRLGYLFNWDEDTLQWSVSGVRDGFPDESADVAADDERAAAIEAIRYLAE